MQLLIALLLAGSLGACQPAPAGNGSVTGAPCSAPEYRQFDFWAGRWTVSSADGTVVGTNEIQIVHGGCVLLENWRGARGMTGTSLTTYVPAEKRWQQTWTDSSGLLLVLEGGLRGGAMQMTGAGLQPGSAASLNRIAWTPHSDGTVRQLWESSSDGGKTWTVLFDGRYVREK